MSEINDRPDPDQTRETKTPAPNPPTRHIPPSPADGPTRFIPVTPPRQAPRQPGPPARPGAHPPPAPPPPPPRYRPPTGPPRPPSPPPAGSRPRHDDPPEQLPWWQTINRDRPPKPPPSPKPAPAPAKAAHPPAAPPRTPTTSPAAAGRSKAWWWVTALAAAAVAIAGTALAISLTETRPPARVLDIAKAQRQVEQILRDPLDGYGAGTVTGVECNNGINPTISRGSGFSCDAIVDGAPRRIAVAFQNDDGTYAVDRPR